MGLSVESVQTSVLCLLQSGIETNIAWSEEFRSTDLPWVRRNLMHT